MNVQAARWIFLLNVKKARKDGDFCLDKMDNIELSIYDVNKVLIHQKRLS
jgi:hypothetical protein